MNRPSDPLAESLRLAPRLTIEQRRHLLACLLSDETNFSKAYLCLKAELLSGVDEVGFKAVWSAALKLSTQYGGGFLFGDRNQAWNALDTEAKALFRDRPDLYPVNHWDFAFGENGFLAWLYGQCHPSEFNSTYGARLLSDFLQERAINDVWRELTNLTTGTVVTNFAEVAHQLARQQRDLCAVGVDPVRSGAPEGWLPPAIMRRPTTIKWLDSFLRGGHRAGETYLVSGANGSGKTTLGLQIAQGVASNEIFLAGGGEYARPSLEAIGWDPSVPYEMGYSYYFHYEMAEDDIRMKLWSAAAMIDYDRIAEMGKPGFKLSETGNLSVDEIAMLQVAVEQMGASISDYPGEQQRLANALKKLDRNFRQVDCSGAIPGVGAGYIPEIAAILGHEKRQGRRAACVVIDYASACVERHSPDPDAHYHLLATFCRRCEEEIANAMGCPVWILQQLSGESNTRTASTRQQHGNTRGCKSMGDTPWFAFNIGTSDEKSGCRYFTVSKARRAQLGTPPILKIANGFNRLIDVSTEFTFDRRGAAVRKDRPKAAAEAVDPLAGASHDAGQQNGQASNGKAERAPAADSGPFKP